jgi:sortase (surface protein transpeptidase)
MGHNYDNGYFAWEGVFVNIKSMVPGDPIIVYTEGGGEYRYTVQLVKKVRWLHQNSAEAEKHLKFLGPTPSEQLTLVTCGGANVWPWPARLYVVAAPAP